MKGKDRQGNHGYYVFVRKQLTNIIWDEAGESDDHIVPYPDQIEEKPPVLFGDPAKKETNQQISNITPVEQMKHTVKSEHGVELDSSCKHDIGESATGFGLDSWPDGPDPSSSNAAKSDQDSIGAATSNNVTKSLKSGSLRGEATQFDKDSDIFENPQEDGEQGDFVDYGWANIGSFDDLDRIFSNSDPIFGDISAGNADELWPSSKDVGSTPLSGDSSDLPIGAQRTSIDRSMLDPNQSFISGYEKLNEITSHASQDVQASIDTIEQSGGSETEQKSDVRQLHDLSGTWTSSGSPLQQANSHYAPSLVNQSPPLMLTQQSPLQRPGPFQPKHFSGPHLASPLYGNMLNHYPAIPVLAQVSSGYEVPLVNANSSKNSEGAAVRPPAMTPREKIEKLRRRQQMRAILAIQKQQLQFGNQASVSDHSSMEGGKVEVDEGLSNFPSVEPNSPIEQYDSNAIGPAFDNCSVEESVLYRLQDTIAKVSHRFGQYPNDTSSTSTSSRDEARSNKDIVSSERFTRMPDVETDTNPIDRTVAHLLFHRPLEFPGKLAEMPESPLSANLPYLRKSDSMKSLAKGYFPENTQITSPQGSKSVFSDGDQSKNGPGFVTSENASNNKNTDGGQMKIETSK
ncbi:hypothetical protein DH2020_002886 [Rehmannia glutinosa]|uniref:Protein LNK2 n=1 Tax=Rehmannia glutinosa TaxID=99300 RepID=A0ABR0XV00_REHGL